MTKQTKDQQIKELRDSYNKANFDRYFFAIAFLALMLFTAFIASPKIYHNGYQAGQQSILNNSNYTCSLNVPYVSDFIYSNLTFNQSLLIDTEPMIHISKGSCWQIESSDKTEYLFKCKKGVSQ